MIKELYKAIKKHVDLEDETIMDAGTHGADGGFGGFTYNNDCIDFFDENSDLIQEFAIEEAEQMGYKNWMEMVASFGRADMLNMVDGYKVLMAWYVLEEVGRWLENNKDES